MLPRPEAQMPEIARSSAVLPTPESPETSRELPTCRHNERPSNRMTPGPSGLAGVRRLTLRSSRAGPAPACSSSSCVRMKLSVAEPEAVSCWSLAPSSKMRWASCRTASIRPRWTSRAAALAGRPASARTRETKPPSVSRKSRASASVMRPSMRSPSRGRAGAPRQTAPRTAVRSRARASPAAQAFLASQTRACKRLTRAISESPPRKSAMASTLLSTRVTSERTLFTRSRSTHVTLPTSTAQSTTCAARKSSKQRLYCKKRAAWASSPSLRKSGAVAALARSETMATNCCAKAAESSQIWYSAVLAPSADCRR
mmetsp:Transcript_45324/g.144460  ORF Transcript_45324/g.144460 Transcript_45324/m.144460 type:complete len:314 (+) Transcript_45324:446-1387(+)